jgi:hypothetical protein
MNIQHHVATILQPNLNDCWAAATAMAMRRHSEAGTQHVKSLAAAGGVALDNGTLPDSSVLPLARAVHFFFHDFTGARVLTLQELARLLMRGPVVALGFFNIPSLGQNSVKHAVTIFALVGDGTDGGTTIKLIDPGATSSPLFSDDWKHFDEQVADITFLLSY